MALQQYLSFSKKIHSQLLSKFCKHSLTEHFLNTLSKGLRQRALNKLTVPVNKTESNPPNQQRYASKHTGDVRKIFEHGNHSEDLKTQSELIEQSSAASESAACNTGSKVKSSLAARKHFKKTFLDKFPSLIRETEGGKTDDADIFGTLSHNAALNSFDKEERNSRDDRNANERLSDMFPEDVDEVRDRRLNIPLTREGRIGKNAYYYTRKMSILGRQGKIKEAIAIFDHWMMLRDRVMPNKRTFNVLIGILGRVGYTDKAFEVYTKMRNLGLDPEDQVYTGLFNACANSPWPKKSLKQAENLLSALQNKGVQANIITLKAAAKAMAFCGNFPKAFIILDEASNYMSLDVECFDHLLMACAADKQRGFQRALQVWQKMQEFNVQPQTSTYNLLIRNIRDCGIGDPDEFAKALGLGNGESILIEQALLLKSVEPSQCKDKSDNQLALPAKGATYIDQMISYPLNAYTCWSSSEKSDMDTGESLSLKQESHNLFHDIPDFDRNMEEFLMHRDAQREKSGSVDMYEWWENQPLNMQQQHEEQLSLVGQLNCSDLEAEQYTTEAQLEALNLGLEDDNLLSETVCSDNTTHTIKGMSNRGSCSSELVPKLSQNSSNQVRLNQRALHIKDITTPDLRLALLGGARKLVIHMSDSGAVPDVRTFSQLVPCLPNTEVAENELLQLMKEMKITPDVDLFNDIMLKRNFRHNGQSAKDLLPVMSKLGLVPNMRTYAALALTCLKEYEAHRLLSDMKAANFEPSSEVMGHFIYISRTNFSYKLHMLQKMEWMGLSPVPQTITAIEKSIAITKKNIIVAEKKKDRSSFYLSDEYQKSFCKFLNFYKGWLQRTALHKAPHPWRAFQVQNNIKGEDNDDEN